MTYLSIIGVSYVVFGLVIALRIAKNQIGRRKVAFEFDRHSLCEIFHGGVYVLLDIAVHNSVLLASFR